MPVRNGRPQDEQPLFRAVNEQRLMGPVSGGREEQEQPRSAEEPQAAPQAEAHQAEKGPVARAVDRAQENNWVYPSMANKAREKGLLDKADEVLNRFRASLSSK